MLKHNWKKSAHLLCSILLVLLMGCAQDSAFTEPKLVDENAGIGFREEDPDPRTDCRCFMSMRNTVNAANGVLWGFNDFTNKPAPPLYQQQGQGNLWDAPAGSGNYVPLPSTFDELNPPSNGWHTFSLYYEGLFDPNFAINTTVRCFLQNPDGSQTLATTTYHTFRFGDGIPTADAFTRIFNRQFSCLVLDDPGGPTPGPTE